MTESLVAKLGFEETTRESKILLVLGWVWFGVCFMLRLWTLSAIAIARLLLTSSQNVIDIDAVENVVAGELSGVRHGALFPPFAVGVGSRSLAAPYDLVDVDVVKDVVVEVVTHPGGGASVRVYRWLIERSRDDGRRGSCFRELM